MDEARYCREVCGGACCRLHLPDEGIIHCPRLNADNSCSCYTERYGGDDVPDLVVVGYWQSRKYKTLDNTPAVRPFWCGKVEQVYARGGLSKEVADRCCVIHPELLEEKV